MHLARGKCVLLSLSLHQRKLPLSDNRHVDMNVVVTGSGDFVEVQGTGEKDTFSRSKMDQLLRLSRRGIKELIRKERDVLKDIPEMQSLCPDKKKGKG